VGLVSNYTALTVDEVEATLTVDEVEAGELQEAHMEYNVIQWRVVFEALDAYLPMYYVWLVRRDRDFLKLELLETMRNDQLRRIGLETLFPLAVDMWYNKDAHSTVNFVHRGSLYMNLKHATRKSGLAGLVTAAVSVTWTKISDMTVAPITQWYRQVTNLPTYVAAKAQQFRGVYDDFDDQIEMITQYGYVVLFSSQMPLLPLCAVLSNIVESRSDLFKLCFALRRPVPERFSPEVVQAWLPLMAAITWASFVSNHKLKFDYS